MIIDCISDLHGYYPKLEGGDLLIVAGDLTARDTPSDFERFREWIAVQDYRKKIVIAGNHDNICQGMPLFVRSSREFKYLCDSGCEVPYHWRGEPPNLDRLVGPYKKKTLKIWGSPWTPTFLEMNPHCKAFTKDTEAELAEKWDLIPEDVDILVTHGPPCGILDCVKDYRTGKMKSVGSMSLLEAVKRAEPLYHIFGHVHEGHGITKSHERHMAYTTFVNCSRVDENYMPVRQAVRIEL